MRAIDAVIALGQRAHIIWAAAVAAVVSVWLLTWGTPSVAPLYPAELDGGSDPGESGQTMLAMDSMDFVFRPLFRTSRTPFVDDSVPQEVPPMKNDVPAGSIDGVRLLGVFSSGEAGGAIFFSEEEGQFRVYEGESLRGWRLASTGLRSAVFASDDGTVATLDLALASSLPVPSSSSRPAPGGVERAPEPGPELTQDDVAEADAGEPAPSLADTMPDGIISFESMNERRRKRQASEQGE